MSGTMNNTWAQKFVIWLGWAQTVCDVITFCVICLNMEGRSPAWLHMFNWIFDSAVTQVLILHFHPEPHWTWTKMQHFLILTHRAFSDNPIFLSSVQSVSPLLIHDNDFWHNYLALARDHLAC